MIEIADKKIGSSDPVFIIAEAGVNHNGKLELAKRLVDKAAEAGADAVKFQTFKTENLVSKAAPKANYQNQTTAGEESQFEMLKNLELSFSDHVELKEHCNKKDILFMSTPFDFVSVDVIDELEVPLYKIGSSDTNNLPLLRYIANKNKPIILSTGMSTLAEVEEAVGVILGTGNEDLVLLHCVSNYPASYKEVNLKAMDTLQQAFNLPVGYSDHTLGTEVPIAAVSKGAVVIEKHFTLDKSLEGPDHRASLEPKDLELMIKNIRNVKQALGTGIKQPTISEQENIDTVRKSLVLTQGVEEGEVLTREVVRIKRPGTGIAPKFLETILGMEVKQSLKQGQVLKWEAFKNE